jgi:very-short-patch-repair endonuclease
VQFRISLAGDEKSVSNRDRDPKWRNFRARVGEGGVMRGIEVDRRVQALAMAHNRVASRRALNAAGISDDMIMSQVAGGHQDGDARRTRSWGERRLLALVRQAGLPVPVTNVLLHGHQVDALWPEYKLVVEIDGYEYHGSRGSFESDRARDAKLVAAGYVVIRFTARQLEECPLVVLTQLAAALALASETNA